MHYIGGVIPTSDWGNFYRLIFRVSRGNVLMNSQTMKVEAANKILDDDFFENKTVFVLAFE